MTLEQWKAKYRCSSESFRNPHPYAGLTAVPRSPGEPGYVALVTLSDFVVETHKAGTVWLRDRVLAIADLMKREIQADIQAGRVPDNVQSFSELHDYVDANMYGGAEKLLEKFGLDVAAGILNKAQDQVEAWIKQRNV
jgi:hypothetical protein